MFEWAKSKGIQQHPGWQYAGVYSDEALTGTKDDRAAFQRLLSDCRAGLIDMVITKSISRFARNTVHTLETVRELKALGVDVFFEEEDMNTDAWFSSATASSKRPRNARRPR